MAKQGDVIENPVFGDRIVFNKTAADTRGQVLEGDLYAKPGALGPPRARAIATTYFDTIYLAKPPLLVQRIAFGLLAFVGRLAGYRPDYPYPYSTSR